MWLIWSIDYLISHLLSPQRRTYNRTKIKGKKRSQDLICQQVLVSLDHISWTFKLLIVPDKIPSDWTLHYLETVTMKVNGFDKRNSTFIFTTAYKKRGLNRISLFIKKLSRWIQINSLITCVRDWVCIFALLKADKSLKISSNFTRRLVIYYSTRQN